MTAINRDVLSLVRSLQPTMQYGIVPDALESIGSRIVEHARLLREHSGKDETGQTVTDLIMTLEKFFWRGLTIVCGLANETRPAINRLPAEILADILHMASGSKSLMKYHSAEACWPFEAPLPDELGNIMNVCRRWRDLVVMTPSLWPFIVEKCGRIYGSHLLRSYPTTPPRLKIYALDGFSTSMAQTLRFCGSMVSQLHVAFHYSDSISEKRLLSALHADGLQPEHCTIHISGPVTHSLQQPLFTDTMARHLRSLFLRVPSAFLPPQPMSMLNRLVLDRVEDPNPISLYDLAALINFLAGLPTLKLLHLNRIFLRLLDSDTVATTAWLPNLQHFDYGMPDPATSILASDQLSLVFTHIIFPHACHVHVTNVGFYVDKPVLQSLLMKRPLPSTIRIVSGVVERIPDVRFVSKISLHGVAKLLLSGQSGGDFSITVARDAWFVVDFLSSSLARVTELRLKLYIGTCPYEDNCMLPTLLPLLPALRRLSVTPVTGRLSNYDRTQLSAWFLEPVSRLYCDGDYPQVETFCLHVGITTRMLPHFRTWRTRYHKILHTIHSQVQPWRVPRFILYWQPDEREREKAVRELDEIVSELVDEFTWVDRPESPATSLRGMDTGE